MRVKDTNGRAVSASPPSHRRFWDRRQVAQRVQTSCTASKKSLATTKKQAIRPDCASLQINAYHAHPAQRPPRRTCASKRCGRRLRPARQRCRLGMPTRNTAYRLCLLIHSCLFPSCLLRRGEDRAHGNLIARRRSIYRHFRVQVRRL